MMNDAELVAIPNDFISVDGEDSDVVSNAVDAVVYLLDTVETSARKHYNTLLSTPALLSLEDPNFMCTSWSEEHDAIKAQIHLLPTLLPPEAVPGVVPVLIDTLLGNHSRLTQQPKGRSRSVLLLLTETCLLALVICCRAGTEAVVSNITQTFLRSDGWWHSPMIAAKLQALGLLDELTFQQKLRELVGGEDTSLQRHAVHFVDLVKKFVDVELLKDGHTVILSSAQALTASAEAAARRAAHSS